MLNETIDDRELLAVCTAVKHFKQVVESQQFAMYTYHKPLIYAIKPRSRQRLTQAKKASRLFCAVCDGYKARIR